MRVRTNLGATADCEIKRLPSGSARTCRRRRRAGFSQEELGKLASLHRTHIGYIEIGQRLPRVDNLAKLTSALAVRADELLEGIDWIVTTPTRPGNFDVDPRS